MASLEATKSEKIEGSKINKKAVLASQIPSSFVATKQSMV
jgi:hypothetical protein